MKKFILYTLLLVPTLFYQSCQDPCSGVVCFNEARCDDGECKCPYGPEDGYTEDCQKITADVLPTVKTNGVGSVTQTSVIAQGEVMNIGGSPVTTRGVCWSKTSTAPSILADNKTVDGQGVGNFNASISGLLPASKYYYRAYATNSAGTAYGETQSFYSTGGPGPNVTDIDGNSYPTIYIDGKLWMAQNLTVTKYRNGDPIPGSLTEYGWSNTHSGAYSIYDNNAVNNGRFGKLYNWYTVNDSRKIAPDGWHVPSREEWQSLMVSLGGYMQAGGKLKDTWATYWDSPNVGATNESGFNGRGGGCRHQFDSEYYLSKGTRGYWWSTTSENTDYAQYFGLENNSTEVMIYSDEKNYGFSVRCVKD